MRKSTWMAQLERALSREGMTGTEKRTVLNYYEEMYQDRFDEGAQEEDIIKEFGFPEDVAQSVRENDGMSRREDVRSGRAECCDYRENDDIHLGRRVPSYDAEANGYSGSGPQYGGPDGPHPPVAKSASATPPPKRDSSSAGVLRTVVYTLIVIALLAVGSLIAVVGVAMIISGFAEVAFSAGICLIALGVGLIVFAVGCLIIGSAVKLARSEFGRKGGVK